MSLSRPLFVLVLALGLAVSFAPASEEGQFAADQVSQTSYENFLNTYLYTHPNQNRYYSSAQHDVARDNIKTLFESFGGLTVQFETFTYNGVTCENIVATRLGTVYPTQEYIIGAHYDSAGTNIPGADDNASGTALVLEAARILSQYPSDYTIRFIAFDAEELGLIGSDRYVAAHPGTQIKGMISTDMVAYDSGTNVCNVFGRGASDPIKNALAAAVTEYGDGLTPAIGPDMPYSDQAPFEAAGYQACLLIEGQWTSNPFYHTSQDNYETFGYINLPYAVKMTRSAVGWLVDAAGVQVPVNTLRFTYPAGLPAYSDPRGRTVVQVDVVEDGVTHDPNTGELHYNLGSGWLTVPMTLVAANRYEVVLPAAPCGTTIHYYFSARGTNGLTYKDPRTAPTQAHAVETAYGIIVLYETTLDTNPQWTADANWEFGPPTGHGGAYGGPDPNSGHTGLNVYGYNLGGDYERNLSEKTLTMPPINCTGYYGVQLSFWRWLGVEQPLFDMASVRVSSAASSGIFVTVWSNATEIADREWQVMDLDLRPQADNKAAVTIRWVMGPTDAGWEYCGWNIDDVSITALDCRPPLFLGDMNCDGAVDFKDINPFVLALTNLAGYESAFPDCDFRNSDVNMDNFVDFRDINPFVALLSGGGQ